MSFDYTTTDKQTDPQSSDIASGVSTLEAPKNLITIVLGNSDALVNKRNQGGVSITIRPDMYQLSRAKFNGI